MLWTPGSNRCLLYVCELGYQKWRVLAQFACYNTTPGIYALTARAILDCFVPLRKRTVHHSVPDTDDDGVGLFRVHKGLHLFSSFSIFIIKFDTWPSDKDQATQIDTTPLLAAAVYQKKSYGNAAKSYLKADYRTNIYTRNPCRQRPPGGQQTSCSHTITIDLAYHFGITDPSGKTAPANGTFGINVCPSLFNV